MTEKELIQKLSQLKDLKAEVNELSQRIANLTLAAKGIQWGRIDLERAQHAEQTVQTLQDEMEARRTQCMEAIGEIYAIIDRAPTSQLRRILSARYLDGMIWREIAFRIGETDEQVPRRIHNRYIKTLTQK